MVSGLTSINFCYLANNMALNIDKSYIDVNTLGKKSSFLPKNAEFYEKKCLERELSPFEAWRRS
jgi:hypothetical protein